MMEQWHYSNAIPTWGIIPSSRNPHMYSSIEFHFGSKLLSGECTLNANRSQRPNTQTGELRCSQIAFKLIYSLFLPFSYGLFYCKWHPSCQCQAYLAKVKMSYVFCHWKWVKYQHVCYKHNILSTFLIFLPVSQLMVVISIYRI